MATVGSTLLVNVDGQVGLDANGAKRLYGAPSCPCCNTNPPCSDCPTLPDQLTVTWTGGLLGQDICIPFSFKFHWPQSPFRAYTVTRDANFSCSWGTELVSEGVRGEQYATNPNLPNPQCICLTDPPPIIGPYGNLRVSVGIVTNTDGTRRWRVTIKTIDINNVSTYTVFDGVTGPITNFCIPPPAIQNTIPYDFIFYLTCDGCVPPAVGGQVVLDW